MKRPTLLALLIALIILIPRLLLAAEPSETEARNLFNALGCKGCHQFEGEGGSLAPPLDEIGSRMTRHQIKEKLIAHTETRKNGFMPSFSTTSDKELDLLSDFLYNHKP